MKFMLLKNANKPIFRLWNYQKLSLGLSLRTICLLLRFSKLFSFFATIFVGFRRGFSFPGKVCARGTHFLNLILFAASFSFPDYRQEQAGLLRRDRGSAPLRPAPQHHQSQGHLRVWGACLPGVRPHARGGTLGQDPSPEVLLGARGQGRHGEGDLGGEVPASQRGEKPPRMEFETQKRNFPILHYCDFSFDSLLWRMHVV